MADTSIHSKKFEALTQYLKELAVERQRVIDATNAAAVTGNRTVDQRYKEIGERQLKQLDTFAKQATDARNFHQRQIYAKTPGSAGNATKEQARVDEQEPEKKLAQSREEQAKQFNSASAEVLGAGGKGYLDITKAGPGVPNYTLGPDGNPITKRPHSVTMLVPKDRNDIGDRQALEEEKARLLDRKKLDTDIGAAFISTTGKPPTADAIFGSGGIQFDPKTGKILSNKTGMVFAGTPEQYYDLQKRFNESQKADKENSRFNEVTVPADTYQALNRKGSEITGVKLPNAIENDIAARELVANARPIEVGAPTLQMQKYDTPPAQIRLPSVAGVPQISIGDSYDGPPPTALTPTAAVGALEKASRGIPAYVPEGLRPAPAYVDQPNEVDRANDMFKAELPKLAAERARRMADSPLLANPGEAPTLSRADIDSIMARSTDPRVSTSGYEQQYHAPATIDQIRSWDPIIYAALKKKAAGNIEPREENWAGKPTIADAARDVALYTSMPGLREATMNNIVRTGVGNLYDMGSGYAKDLFDVGVPVYYPPKIEHPELAGPLGNYD